MKPTIAGSISDNYSPGKAELSFFKQNYFLGIETGRTLFLRETFDLKNTTNQTTIIFSLFPSLSLDYGKYRVEVTGIDKAGNSSITDSFNLWVLPDDKAKQILTEGKTKEEQKKITDELRSKAQLSLPELEKKAILRREKEASEFGKLTQGFGDSISVIASGAKQFLAGFGESVTSAYIDVAKAVPGIVGDTMLAAGKTAADFAVLNYKLGNEYTKAQESTKKQIAKTHKNTSDTIKNKGQRIVQGMDLAFRSLQKPVNESAGFLERTKVWFLTFESMILDANPTSISGVTIEEVGKDYAVVSWKTNHYAWGKVNYGRDLTYGKEVILTKREKLHTARLTGLKPGEKYFFEVMSQNKNYAYGAYYSFETKK